MLVKCCYILFEEFVYFIFKNDVTELRGERGRERERPRRTRLEEEIEKGERGGSSLS